MLDSQGLSVQELNNEGVELCSAGDFERGVAMLRQAHMLAPDDPDVCCSLGNALAQQGDLVGAAEFLSQALQIDPGHVAALELTKIYDISVLHAHSAEGHSGNELGRTVEKAPEVETRDKTGSTDGFTLRKPKLLPLVVACLCVLGAAFIGRRFLIHAQHRRNLSPALTAAYSIRENVNDNPMNRSYLVHTGWTQTAVQMSLDDMRSTPHYFQITSENKKAILVGITNVNQQLRPFEQIGGKLSLLPTLAQDNEGAALCINDDNEVVGYSGTLAHRAVVWKHGAIGFLLREGLSIDDKGDIVVSAIDLQGYLRLVTLVPRSPGAVSATR
jgi:tetratricopeptide (TPR) repeat protein